MYIYCLLKMVARKYEFYDHSNKTCHFNKTDLFQLSNVNLFLFKL